MKNLILFLTLALLTNMISITKLPALQTQINQQTPEFEIPDEYQNLGLIRCKLTKMEQSFAQQFPGTIATFRHPKGIIIFRHVTGATRKLHDSQTCLRSSGFTTTEIIQRCDTQGRTWQHYTAHNRKNSLAVRSIIQRHDRSKSWSSVQQWFWSAFFSAPNTQYLAITEIFDAP